MNYSNPGYIESTSVWRAKLLYRRTRRSTRQKYNMQINNTDTTVQNGSVPYNAAATSRWVFPTTFAKFIRAANIRNPLKGKTIIQLYLNY